MASWLGLWVRKAVILPLFSVLLKPLLCGHLAQTADDNEALLPWNIALLTDRKGSSSRVSNANHI